MDHLKKHFNLIYLVTCTLVFIVICLRSFFIPFTHDEASTFFFYVQDGNFLPYRAHAYTNNHVLNSALTRVCYLVAGSHPFVLRLPNVFAFIVLCFGVFRFSRYLNRTSSKIVLSVFFLLTFNFLDFFELCRGYGLSIGFVVLGLSYLYDYFSEKKFVSLILFSVGIQLALAANLTLLILSALLFVFSIVFQLKEKKFFRFWNILLWLFNLRIFAFWVKFSFYYRSLGLLDSGWGEDYWEVSFKSLMFLVFGSAELWLQVIVLVLFSAMLVQALFAFFKKPVQITKIFQSQFFYLVILCGMICAFYLQKKLLAVNYPEGRTGLFFYVFFVISLVFFLEQMPGYLSSTFASVALFSSLAWFYMSFDLKSFTYHFYHVIPGEFYAYFENENKLAGELLTVGGHVNREMNYTFYNYRHGSKLNPMDESQEMQMNCDYYFALKAEKPFYSFFYDEMVYDERWRRVLLKRKQKIKRTEITALSKGRASFKGQDTYFELLRFNDSVYKAKNCIELDIELTLKNVPKPFKAFIVMEVQNEEGKIVCYKKVPLYWISPDLNGSTRRFKLTSATIPEKFKNIIVCVWNIDSRPCEFELNALKIFELQAPGINFRIPKSYYPYFKRLNGEEEL